MKESNFDSEVNVYADTIKKLPHSDLEKLNNWNKSGKIFARIYINDFVIKYNSSDKEIADFMNKIGIKK